MITGEDVQMIMPNVLVACRFIVLSCGDSIAMIRRFHRQGDLLRRSVNLCGEMNRQIINVLVVVIGDDDDVTLIVCPLMGTDHRRDRFGAIDNVAVRRVNMAILDLAGDETKRTNVILWGVVVHGLWLCAMRDMRYAISHPLVAVVPPLIFKRLTFNRNELPLVTCGAQSKFDYAKSGEVERFEIRDR